MIDIKNLYGCPVDYGFVRDIYSRSNDPKKISQEIPKVYRNRVFVEPPARVMDLVSKNWYNIKKENRGIFVDVIGNHIRDAYIVAEDVRASGRWPYVPKNLADLSGQILYTKLRSLRIIKSTQSPTIIIECTSNMPLYEMLLYLSTIYKNIVIYYDHNGRETHETSRIINGNVISPDKSWKHISNYEVPIDLNRDMLGC